MIKTGEAAKKHIDSLKKEYKELLMFGYTHGGSFAHGDNVKRIKARILADMEELKLFGQITVVY